MCVDYTELNKITVKDVHPLPHIDDIFASLSGSRFFTTLDLARGYWQVKMRESNLGRIAFRGHAGLYTFTRMPFGLTNAPATFQRMMQSILASEIAEGICSVYLDDVMIHSKTFSEHLEHIKRILKRLDEFNLQVKLSKCSFAARKIKIKSFDRKRKFCCTSCDNQDDHRR